MAKDKIKAPIDRPLSRAYLREFTGWSSAYPPGISDPTSLRIMENVQINRDESVRVRPGLRHISAVMYDNEPGVRYWDGFDIVGSHETFFLNDGTKAYLYAVRSYGAGVEGLRFRVLAETPDGDRIHNLTDPEIGFEVPQGEQALAFTHDTTYVKYLQVDNKIFALSDNGESMRLFTVGSNKTAKRLYAIARPEWSVADKLAVVQPDAAWITGATPLSVRTNRFISPDMDNLTGWLPTSPVGQYTRRVRSAEEVRSSGYSMRLESLPEQTNLCPQPLHDISETGLTGWTAGQNMRIVSPAGDLLDCATENGMEGKVCLINGPTCDGIEPGEKYSISLYLANEFLAPGSVFGYRLRWYTAAGAQIGSAVDGNMLTTPGRKVNNNLEAPAGASRGRLFIRIVPGSNNSHGVRFRDVRFGPTSEGTDAVDGDDGVDFFWTGTPNQSASVYHPPQTVEVFAGIVPVDAGDWCGSIYTKAGSTPRDVSMSVQWFGTGGDLGTVASAPAANGTLLWSRQSVTDTAPATTTYAAVRVQLADVPRGEYHYLDDALFEEGSVPGDYFDGYSADTTTHRHSWDGAPHASTSTEATYAVVAEIPTAETPTAQTLISSAALSNDFNFGFFYTFRNEIGESAASQVTTVRAQRSWQAWRWETPNASGEPSGTQTTDPTECADQLVASVPQAAFNAAIAQGAIELSLYMFTWSDQDPTPVEAIKVDTRTLTPASQWETDAWLRVTPASADIGADTALLPTVGTRHNYTVPSTGGQGLVAADRMIMVLDPASQAVIRWTSNQQGSYTDFSASKGGGYKTLTSGNLFIPACVKLWVNPQSVDTLTVLCMGVDGYSTSYYMAPSQVAQQSEAVNVMGFEETTATPGTVSPYGVEVLNNALYHPLDAMLMKSTANNYNIYHKPQTDQIQDMWMGLASKDKIVSAQLDNRLYYLVHNPEGAQLEPGCWGNEVWVYDTAPDSGTWSRWLVQGHSLRKITQAGKVVMSLVRVDGVYYFDPDYARDDVVNWISYEVEQRAIPWRLETNTQGSNRAHDAYAHLQQANVTFGNWQGKVRYGIRSHDIYGKHVEIAKTYRDDEEPGDYAYDGEDFLLIRRDLREWFFFAESVANEDGMVSPSSGQISLVQYRYTPSTVNTGYEYGSIETFEYGRAGQAADNRTTDNGVPMPYVDTGRP